MTSRGLRRSYLRGAATLLDVSGSGHRRRSAGPRRSAAQVDADAIRSDWETVGRDLQRVIHRFERDHDASRRAS